MQGVFDSHTHNLEHIFGGGRSLSIVFEYTVQFLIVLEFQFEFRGS